MEATKLMNTGFKGQDITIGNVVEQANEDGTRTRYKVTKVFKKHFYGTDAGRYHHAPVATFKELTESQYDNIVKGKAWDEDTMYIVKRDKPDNSKIIIVFLIGLAIATTLVLTFS